MPKSKDKTKGAKKRRKSSSSTEVNTAENYGCNSKPGAKKKKFQKRSSIEGVDKSRQLKEKLKKQRASRATSARNKDPKLCGNGKPMPPLSELEKMYEDSDGNDDLSEIKLSFSPDRPVTPPTKPDTMIKDEITNLLSPSSLKNIASKALDLISNTTKDNCPPSSIIPPKKPNRSGIPFIVGCKDREQVPWAPKTSFCIGSPKYGVEPHNEEEYNRKNVGPHYANLSKSIFNAQSDEIAQRLKELDKLESLRIKLPPTTQTTARSGSPDSNKTLPYDFPDSPKSGPRSFSPLPSTSKDRETILKNDELFNQSLKCDSVHSSNSQEDVEIVEIPCETIIIDDTVPDEPKPVPMDIDIDPADLDDDCCIIVESESSIKPKQISNSCIEIEDKIYGGLDLTRRYDDNEVSEIVDVDDIISENTALLEKYNRENDVHSVILVEPNATAIKQNTSNQEGNNGNAFRESRPSYSNGPVLATVENASSRPSVMNFTPAAENRNDIRHVVTSFFRRRPNPSVGVWSGFESAPSEVTSNTASPRPDSETESNNSMGRIMSWLKSVSCMVADNKATRNQSRELVQSNRFSTEINVEPRPRTSTEVSDILTQALANANQQHTRHQHQLVSLPKQCSWQQQPIDNSPKGLGDCPICMDNLSNNAIASTLCGHIFCMNCIKTAIKANGKRCPTCRKALKGVGYHQLFL